MLMWTEKSFQNFPAIEKESEFETGLKFSCEHTVIVHSLWLHTNYFYFNDSIDIFCSSIMLEKVKKLFIYNLSQWTILDSLMSCLGQFPNSSWKYRKYRWYLSEYRRKLEF